MSSTEIRQRTQVIRRLCILPNCQSLTIDSCTFDTDDEELKYGINWNLCGIQGSEVSITNSTFTGTYKKNALKLNQRNGTDDTATDVKPDDEVIPVAASIASATIGNCTFSGTNAIIALGSQGKGNSGAASPSTGAFPVEISNVKTGESEEATEVVVELAYLAAENEKAPTVELGADETASKSEKGDLIPEDTQPVAQIGADTYLSLESAILMADEGSTIELLDTVTLTDGVEIDKTITLDLNGKTIEPASNGWTEDESVDYLLAVKRGGNLTIADSEGAGKIDAKNLLCGVKMTIKGEEEYDGETVLTVNGGTIQGDGYGISGNGNRHGTKITINGGTVKATANNGTAIFQPQDGSLTVNGGIIESSNTAIEIRSGSLTVTGGIITGGMGVPMSNANGSGTTTSNAAVAIAQHTTKKPITVKIEGGTLTGGAALFESDPNNTYDDTSAEKPAIEVTGGTFNGAVSSENVTGFIAGGTFTETVDAKLLAEGWKIENGTAVTEPDNIFEMQDFNLWGDSWKGAFNVGWKFQAGFDTDRITGLEVGMKDSSGKLIIKYTATGDQLVYQKQQGYFSNGGQSSAPFYKEDQSGNPIQEVEDLDWTVRFGEAFDKWDVYSCYVTVTVGETEYTLTNTCTHQHIYDLKNVSDTALKSAATTSSPAIYYKTCSTCGAISSNDVDTFKYGSAISGGGGGSVTAYAITVEDSENGQVEANRTSASRGSSVTLTVTPDEGYELSSLTVTDADGNEIEVTENDGIYRFTMPSSKVTVTAEFTESSENPGTPEEPGTTGLPFTDVVSTDWYYDAVAYAYENDLMNGISSTQFNPNGTTTRGMIATILYRLEGEPEAPACDFTDVAAGQYYTDAVAWAAENHLVNGYGDGTFGPNDNITREQMSALLYRYAEFKGYDLTARGDLSGYTDASQISDYAVTAMQWATAEGLVNGMGDGTLAPRGNSTRAQIATILMRFLENIA